MWINASSDIISKVLSPALKRWLRSQLEQIDDLDLQIQGHDHQILRGYVPCVSLHSLGAVYQGLHLDKIQLRGENIRLNIGQMIKGKPLRFLETLQVTGAVYIKETDLNDSLSSFILSNALNDLLKILLKQSGIFLTEVFPKITWQKITLLEHQFSLTGIAINRGNKTIPLTICAELQLVDPQTLCIDPKSIEGLPEWSDISWQDFQVDLGNDVEIESLHLKPGNISFQGRLLIRTES